MARDCFVVSLLCTHDTWEIRVGSFLEYVELLSDIAHVGKKGLKLFSFSL